MVDMTTLSARHTGAASAKRVGKRRAAETRLKAYGIIALSLAAAALVALLGSVFTKAGGALTETYLTLPITLEASEIDPDGTRDPKIIRRADFSGLSKDMLKEQFPNAKGRTTRRELYDLTSSGAAFELADKVAVDPSLVGQTIDYPFLASDVTDLYLKGDFGDLVSKPVDGNLTLTEQDGSYLVSSTADDFSKALARVKEGLVVEAAKLRGQARLQENGVVEFTRRADVADAAEEREKNAKLADARAAARDALLAQADELEARAAAQGGDEVLDENNRSVLINVAGGWLKMTRITPNGGLAEAVVPMERTVDATNTWGLYTTDLPEASRKVSDNQIIWIEQLKSQGRVDVVFNTRFFTAGDSREPELAGIWGAVAGSFWTMLVTFLLAFPTGVLAAIYLEEFAPKNKLTDFVEVNINNLAAVPSIVFGLLGLSVFLGVFGVPRSAPLAGGIVLALMTLPTIIIAARAAIRAVPPSIRDAAVGLGASPLQTTFHHVLPLAMPGILTGTIIGMAQALGETAPLIMIGMVAFIVDVPGSITDSASVLPVQVFRWSDFPERAFEARTSAAICVLLFFLVVMNAIAVILRKRFERRW
ncbi:phosphate ABC transporter membrane protein 2 (PhoT family) [Litoreibacter halocynthiae]|uniref:Phosphate transport system permease protein PstA n=1 Tax=Litoreibacter halocynthiae TaxID=1242689 RepID=A0A4R7LUE2_9RHOB|nr:phosphate ABC transporter permease PstA [Litoreibacter halocynthiae]TDT77840.1 phosphate ABC transporter membrane protein 2 (PhoT family) [Litoreibacter halocynthiae]